MQMQIIDLEIDFISSLSNQYYLYLNSSKTNIIQKEKHVKVIRVRLN